MADDSPTGAFQPIDIVLTGPGPDATAGEFPAATAAAVTRSVGELLREILVETSGDRWIPTLGGTRKGSLYVTLNLRNASTALSEADSRIAVQNALTFFFGTGEINLESEPRFYRNRYPDSLPIQWKGGLLDCVHHWQSVGRPWPPAEEHLLQINFLRNPLTRQLISTLSVILRRVGKVEIQYRGRSIKLESSVFFEISDAFSEPFEPNIVQLTVEVISISKDRRSLAGFVAGAYEKCAVKDENFSKFARNISDDQFMGAILDCSVLVVPRRAGAATRACEISQIEGWARFPQTTFEPIPKPERRRITTIVE